MSLIREFVRLQTDVGLARQELLLGLAAKPLLNRARLPDGEGRPVLLLPGFGANEATLKRLRSFLVQCGYVAETFSPGFPKNETLHEFIDALSNALSQRVTDLKQRTGKAVSLVGQSAGGIYSREFALRHPENIDRVITLGSPTLCPENLHLQNKALALLIERRFGTSADNTFANDRFVHWNKKSPKIPYVAIYSPVDGAVKAETVVIPESQLSQTGDGAVRENIAILASHFGMVLNPLVLLAVADRLGTDAKNWQAFEPRQYIPDSLRRVSTLAFPPTRLDNYDIPVVDLHPRQPRGRDARERVIRTLQTEHANIEKLLDTVLEELGSNARKAVGVPNYIVLEGILEYLQSYTDGFHHPREDLLFDRLRIKRPELEESCDTLSDEHLWIETEGHELVLQVQRHLESDQSESRNKKLDARSRRYVRKLRRHLRMEESEIFPHAEALGHYDWRAIDRGLAHQDDPLFGHRIQQRYEALAETLAGRVEGISESVALNNVIGLEAGASGLEALTTGLARVRDQQIEQAKDAAETQRRVVRQALDQRSAWALATLPFALAKANVGLTRTNTAASYESAKQLVQDVLASRRQARENP